jgi:hypothetical protein
MWLLEYFLNVFVWDVSNVKDTSFHVTQEPIPNIPVLGENIAGSTDLT